MRTTGFKCALKAPDLWLQGDLAPSKRRGDSTLLDGQVVRQRRQKSLSIFTTLSPKKHELAQLLSVSSCRVVSMDQGSNCRVCHSGEPQAMCGVHLSWKSLMATSCPRLLHLLWVPMHSSKFSLAIFYFIPWSVVELIPIFYPLLNL